MSEYELPTGLTLNEAHAYLSAHYYPAALDDDPQWVEDMIESLTAPAVEVPEAGVRVTSLSDLKSEQ